MNPDLKALKSMKPDLNALKSGQKPLEHFTSLKSLKYQKSLKYDQKFWNNWDPTWNPVYTYCPL